MQNKRFKKVISLLLAIVMVFGLSVNGFATENKIPDGSSILPSRLTDAVELKDELGENVLAAYERINRINRPSGLVGFGGDYPLDNAEKIPVIVEFINQPTKVAQIESAVQTNKFLSADQAETAAENDHVKFQNSLNGLFGMTGRSAKAPYQITSTYHNAINGVAITLPANKISEVAKFDSVYAIYPDNVVTLDPDEAAPDSEGMATEREYLGINGLHEAGITGKGITVCVIDTGVDYNHPDLVNAFGTESPTGNEEDLLNGKFYGRSFIVYSEGMETYEGLPERAANDPMETTYKDWQKTNAESSGNNIFYTTHGTHVSGTIAARGENGPFSALGMAPDATLYVYRALGPYGMGYDSWVLAAIDQVAVDKPDVVNMSLGSTTNDPYALDSLAINSIMLANPDILFAIAAGNAGPSNYVVGSPGTSSTAITVANGTVPQLDSILEVEANGGSTIEIFSLFRDWDSNVIPNDDGSYAITYPDLLENENNEYKLVPVTKEEYGQVVLSDGSASFYTDEMIEKVKGNIAVIIRGNTILDSLANAKAAGAGGLLLINNASGDFSAINYFRGENSEYLPVYSISYEDGMTLLDQAGQNDNFIKVTGIKDSAGKLLASSSSCGPVFYTYDIKPDITAPGTSVLSTVPYYYHDQNADEDSAYEESYARFSGTSMASPHIAGIVALLKQYSNDNSLEWTAEQIKARLMNNADPLADDYSVYQVGSGYVNPAKALYAESYAAVYKDNVSTIDSDTEKAMVGSFSFGIGRTNTLSSETLKASVFNDTDIKKAFNITYVFNAAGQGVKNADLAGITLITDESVDVSANNKADFSVTINAPETTVYEDAGFYEGYVILTNELNPDEVYTLPFAYYLKSSEPPFELAFLNQPAISSNPETRQIAQSSKSDLYFSIKNAFPYLQFVIVKGDNPDEIVGLARDYFEVHSGINTNEIYYIKDVLDGSYHPPIRDEGGRIISYNYQKAPLEPGYYKLRLDAVSMEGTDDTTFVDFYVDNAAPELIVNGLEDENTLFYDQGISEITVSGSLYDLGIKEMADLGIKYEIYEEGDEYPQIPDQSFNGLFVKINDTYTRIAVDKVSGAFEFTVPTNISSFKLYGLDSFSISAIAGEGYNPPAIAPGFDPHLPSYQMGDYGWYGLNMVEKEIIVEDSTPKVSLNSNELKLQAGESYTLSAKFNLKATGDSVASWTTSNSQVATVNNGVVTGIVEGTAVITVLSANGLTASCNVTIANLPSDGVILPKGSFIYYGTYKHANASEPGQYGLPGPTKTDETATPVLWEVMGEEKINGVGDGNLTIYSKYILDGRPFSWYFGMWDMSTLREYLNNEFLDNLSDSESINIPKFNLDVPLYDYNEVISPTYSYSLADQQVYLPWLSSYYRTGTPLYNSVYWSSGKEINNDNALVRMLEAGSPEYDKLKGTFKNGTPMAYFLSTMIMDFRAGLVYEDGNVAPLGGTASAAYGFRPITKIVNDSIVYAAEIKANAGLGSQSSDDTNYIIANPDSKYYKLTVLGADNGANIGTLSNIPSVPQVVGFGKDFTIANTATSQTGSDYKIAYKIVGEVNGQRTIVNYGEFDANQSVKDITLDTKSLPAGQYRVYTWLQKNNPLNSNEAGTTQSFDLTVKQVKINVSAVNIIKKGSTFSINAVAYPEGSNNGNLTYTSSNPNIATVDANGTVKAISAGNVIIKVRSEDIGFGYDITIKVNP